MSGAFLIAIAIGRTIRYSLEGWMAVRYGDAGNRDLFKQHYPKIGLGLAITIVYIHHCQEILFRPQR
jgi:hypothetical protein